MKAKWSHVRLDELTEPNSPITYGVVKPGDPGDVLFIRGGDIANGRVLDRQLRTITQAISQQYKRTVLRGGEILMCLVGQPGQVAVAPATLAGANIARQVGLIRLRSDVNAEFVTYFLRSPDGQAGLGAHTGGAVQQVINLSDLKTVTVPLPSLPEQQRIVGILDEAFAGLATAEANAARNLQNAREIFDSHLHAVFGQRGEGWVEKTIGDLGRVSMCKRIFKQETSATGDIPFYKIGTFGREPDAYIQSETYNQYRAKYPYPKKGDVLISAAGTIGRRVRYDGEPAYFQDSNIVWIDNDEERVLNDYLYHFYGSCQWNCTTGATISRLYNDDLRAIALAFPVSHQQQRDIVEKLDALAAETQRLTRLYEQKQAALAALKASLLHCAFSGEL